MAYALRILLPSTKAYGTMTYNLFHVYIAIEKPRFFGSSDESTVYLDIRVLIIRSLHSATNGSSQGLILTHKEYALNSISGIIKRNNLPRF
jgi:hypothetical protein